MWTRRRIIQFGLLQGAGTLALPLPSRGAQWPDRPVRIVVPNPPGGTADITARIVFERVGAAVHQSFIVENRAGGNGTIAMVAVARSKPDGYTFVVAGDSATYVPLVQEPPSFTMERDFVPVSLLVAQPVVLAVHPDTGIRSVADLISRAKAEPGKLSYGVSGVGSTHHVAAEMFCSAANISMTSIPYKGGGQAIADLIAGQIPVACPRRCNRRPCTQRPDPRSGRHLGRTLDQSARRTDPGRGRHSRHRHHAMVRALCTTRYGGASTGSAATTRRRGPPTASGAREVGGERNRRGRQRCRYA